MEQPPPIKESAPKDQAEDINFHDLTRERANIRRRMAVGGLDVAHITKLIRAGESEDTILSSVPRHLRRTYGALMTELKDAEEEASQFRIAELGGFSAAKESLLADRESSVAGQWLDEEAIKSEIADYDTRKELAESVAAIRDLSINETLALRIDPHASRGGEQFFANLRVDGGDIEKEQHALTEKDPIASRALDLVSYKQGLHQEGHIAPTPSVEKHLKEIGDRIAVGKPMFLHGPTGTGKTSLAHFAAKHFTGKEPEMVYCTPQIRMSDIWGKTGIIPAEGEAGKHGAIRTIDIYGPLARAMQGGTAIIFDEFTTIDPKDMSFIKGVLAMKPGDMVNVVGNGQITLAPGFQAIFTANLKSEKNPERQDMPPEIKREFEQNNLEIGYTPGAESYDIILARLMDRDGSLTLSSYDLNETLPALCRAMDEIQSAYTGTTDSDVARLIGAMDASGKTPGLKDFVMTHGSIETILDLWKAEKRSAHTPRSFVEFLDDRLKTALTFKAYPEKDRILAAKIFTSKGFLRTLQPEELDLPNEIFSFDVARKLRAGGADELIARSKEETRLPLSKVAELDPFGTRGAKMRDLAEEFLGDVQEKGAVSMDVPPLETLKSQNEAFFKETFEQWYGKNTADTVKQAPVLTDPRTQDYGALKTDDPSKFGEYTLNPEMQVFTGKDFEHMAREGKIKVLDLAQFVIVNKPCAEVARHIMDTYGATHHIPGIEFWKWLIEESENAPQDVKEKLAPLKDGNYHYFFGSTLRNRDGKVNVPLANWAGGEWRRYADWVGFGWRSSERVVLLEK